MKTGLGAADEDNSMERLSAVILFEILRYNAVHRFTEAGEGA